MRIAGYHGLFGGNAALSAVPAVRGHFNRAEINVLPVLSPRRGLGSHLTNIDTRRMVTHPPGPFSLAHGPAITLASPIKADDPLRSFAMANANSCLEHMRENRHFSQ